MPLGFRLIARLDIRNSHLIKTRHLEGVRKVGDPFEHARRYDQFGIDEMLYLDVVASLYGRNALGAHLARASEAAFCPLTAGGGVRSHGDVRALMVAGADKAAVNTAALGMPELIGQIAGKFGAQALTIQIDAKRKGASWEAYCEGGRQPSGRDAVAWAREAAERGAGEILLTSIDREGTRQGFDLALIEAVAKAVPVPVIAAGGYGAPQHAAEAAQAGASGIAIAGGLHYAKDNPLPGIREALTNAGIAVRPAA